MSEEGCWPPEFAARMRIVAAGVAQRMAEQIDREIAERVYREVYGPAPQEASE